MRQAFKYQNKTDGKGKNVAYTNQTDKVGGKANDLQDKESGKGDLGNVVQSVRYIEVLGRNNCKLETTRADIERPHFFGGPSQRNWGAEIKHTKSKRKKHVMGRPAPPSGIFAKSR